MNELDNEEQELLATFERGEWQSVKERNRLLELQGYAKASIDFISRFEAWKARLVSNPNILGGGSIPLFIRSREIKLLY